MIRDQETKIIDALKVLKEIKPEDGFVELSRRLILVEEQEVMKAIGGKPWSLFGLRLSKTTVLVGLAILVAVSGGILLRERQSATLAKTNKQNLLSEAQSLNFDIKLQEVKYFNQSAENVTVVLNEVFVKKKQ